LSSKRLFFALWPNDRQRDQLRNVISPAAKEVEGQAVYRGSWHVTLAFLGDIPEERIPEVRAIERAVKFEPFRTRFDKAEYWARPKVAVLSAATVPTELQHLVLQLETMLEKLDVPTDEKTFRPHITIVRRARPFETQRLAQPALVEWTGFELIESVPEPGGSSYRPLKQ
jgi:2'-5' RNA ligase